MTRRLPSRPDRDPPTRYFPSITYRHILAPSAPAPARAMDRTGYPSNRRPSFGSRRSSSHIPRRDPPDLTDAHHRTLAVRPRYPDRAASTAATAGYDTGIRSSVIYCPPPPARPSLLRQGPSLSGSYLGDALAGLDELPRRTTEVYEVPVSYNSDLDAGGGGGRGRSSSGPASRPSSRGSEFVFAEYEEEEERERERKRLLGSELYGYVMAMRLKDRLAEVRQVLQLYKDFDRASGRKCRLAPPPPPLLLVVCLSRPGVEREGASLIVKT